MDYGGCLCIIILKYVGPSFHVITYIVDSKKVDMKKKIKWKNKDKNGRSGEAKEDYKF